MNYEVVISENFKKEFKKMHKKYPSLKSDLQLILDNIENELKLATDLGSGFKKLRIQIKSKGKGKRGGGRIITYETILAVDTTHIVFGSIYNKGEFENISIELLKQIIDLSN
ncbi:MAG TPA: type II toxin-antitoxin system RelE/ParE family toxin [Moheibacter sp.]|nr:type II toxin-antitoxin system RelE/ParE family toxin [Moheibacter sp.]